MAKQVITIQPDIEADFTIAGPYQLERGEVLPSVTLHYAIYGDLKRNADRVVLVCHALSGSARVADWWGEMFGPGLPFDTDRCCIVGVNIIGSCYGSTGPTSLNPATGKSYGPDFPVVTVGDSVRAQALLLDHLGVKQLHATVGGSIGGMQALEWALRYPERVKHAVVIGTAPLNAMGLALNHLQRQAIWNDPEYSNGWYEKQPAKGLGLARALAMCSYKSGELFDERYGRKPNRNGEDPFTSVKARFDVAGYLDHQEEIFVNRFDANTFITITKLMDSWDLPVEDTVFAAIAQQGVKLHFVGISSDWLFPPQDVRKISERFARLGIETSYSELVSAHGHDAFLADAHLITGQLNEVLHGGESRR
ncbi:MAG TPA: homoserine O-acetyltransferase, partial [Terriglobales bacterium]|nr:homoserine O-acetyltransferase [Terriglobales bacterium]